ncbi:chromosomal replication initiation protein [Hyphomicrobium denitrificans 1NES1]|uniref:Chromosomal replication initiator protein DnaA n=1 Tax=Hyphomicrobium denitrificans 1NES1 TaxID=670307 RepID=N0B807_9HYPH|nr:chromosomal replication initiator protein DnaA [Hyphomicrobium denitrificans]AGK56195.1 chromosomal replication initiation protein [Hyphomicrobium denitrificans 1NES1]
MQAAKTAEAQSVSGAQGTAVVETATDAIEGRGQKVRAMLRAQLGEEIYSSWFKSLEFEGFDGRVVKVSVPVKFVRNWIQEHYAERLLHCSRVEFATAERVEVVWRQPGAAVQRPAETRVETPNAEKGPAAALQTEAPARVSVLRPPVLPAQRTSAGGLEGSPLDPRYTFDSFVVGASNRMAHAGATQVAETVLSDAPGYNPLYIHSAVGLGKSHLLQAIAWEVKRRAPTAQVLYLTAERFRYQFVEALRSSDPLAFKERFRNIHMLLIDDLEFLQGERTEQEFDHIINALLDGGKQVVVASARAPNQIERLNERMRSRLQRGLVTELMPLDHELRLKVLEKRLGEKRAADPSFTLSRDVVELLALRLTENGRELEGAVTRLYATWQYMRTPITLDIAETVIRDLVQNLEPRRIKIEDILRIISRHYGVSKGDLLSQRRHRSVVWPRQIGMYLAKHLTARSLPEIGRRFGGRDHTTVLHAIRKIEGEITKNPHLGDELEELKRLLNH